MSFVPLKKNESGGDGGDDTGTNNHSRIRIAALEKTPFVLTQTVDVTDGTWTRDTDRGHGGGGGGGHRRDMASDWAQPNFSSHNSLVLQLSNISIPSVRVARRGVVVVLGPTEAYDPGLFMKRSPNHLGTLVQVSRTTGTTGAIMTLEATSGCALTFHNEDLMRTACATDGYILFVPLNVKFRITPVDTGSCTIIHCAIYGTESAPSPPPQPHTPVPKSSIQTDIERFPWHNKTIQRRPGWTD